MRQMVGLGIDVGGTNTDAVLIDLKEKKILSFAKAPTTKEEYSRGVQDVLKRLDTVYFPKISLISLSTTLATNAIVEGVRRRIRGVLIGYEPDMYPAEMEGEVILIPGGHTVEGEEKELLDLEALKVALEEDKDEIEAYAVCGYFSVRNPDHELRAKQCIQEITQKPVVCGHEISPQLDAVKRATTTLLNAHLIPVIQELMTSVERVFCGQDIRAPLMVVRGDGSLMSESAIRYRPIETILSGPAASVIGAVYLLGSSGEAEDAVIVDIGGTTTDIALLERGLPKLNPRGARVGNWHTNVVAIDIRTIGLGGDSEISFGSEGTLRVGPRRIIPLSYLGYCYPKIHEELRRIQGDRRFVGLSKTADFWVRLGQRTQPGLGSLPERVLSEVTENPLSLFQLARVTGADPGEIRKSLSLLERFGLVQQSGVTPTDILHVTGVFQAWDREAAGRGAQLLCEQSSIGLSSLVQELEETMDRSMGVQILELLLAESIGPGKGPDGCGFCDLFLDQCFRWDARMDGLQLHAKVKRKIIGIGAPAHAFLPSVAEKLGTQVVIPSHAGVANAVGAITSAVAITEDCCIKPYRGGFHLHASSGVAFFANLEDAEREGEKRLRESATRKAREAGADGVEVMIDSQEKRATTSGGDSVFIEKTIVAHAVGTPRMYHEDVPGRVG